MMARVTTEWRKEMHTWSPQAKMTFARTVGARDDFIDRWRVCM